MTAGKANFTDMYTAPDPRRYFATLGSLDYEIPTHGCSVFEAVLDEIRVEQEQPAVLDLCCSYGINAALLNHTLTLDELESHYAEADGVPYDLLVERDRAWFESRRRDDTVEVVGADVSGPAVRYALDAGLLSDGLVVDLENEPLSAEDAAKISEIDLVTVTGGIGYVKERTFEQILEATEEPPWVAALSLRWIDFDPIAETLESQGLVTEKLDGFVAPQRRFADAGERDFVLGELASRGIDTTPVEESGHHGAELYLARPVGAIDRAPLEDLLSPLI